MNSEFWAAFVKQFLMALLSSAALQQYVSGDQAVAIASGAGALATLGYTLWAHYGMRKVPDTAVVSHFAADITTAKADSIPGAK